MKTSDEKLKILELDGNVLVTANPGTGKTRLLALKFISLLEKGLKPEEILCLTFTNKAKKEMEQRILSLLEENKIKTDVSKLNIHTFHSYALDYLNQEEVISSNLLRYSIFRYLKENEVLNYGDEYLIETIVPRLENLIRYLKSFGIMPEDIDLNEVKKNLSGFNERISKEEMEKFAEDFVGIFKHYEEIKRKKGIDYTDMLLQFLAIKNKPRFKHVLIDELQDVNKIEAEIALQSADQFFAVGDKKQAIFGFQGGSINNFKLFENSKQEVLSQNYRSTDQILDYSKEFFVSKTQEKTHVNELKELKSAIKKEGVKPKLYSIEKEELVPTVCELAKKTVEKGRRVAVIARTNTQIMQLSKELQNRGLECSSTFFAASADAKGYIITFLKGVLSNDLNDIKSAMFTPFFPIALQDAFELAGRKRLTTEEIYEKSPEFKKLKESVKTVEDANLLFKERVFPLAVCYGKEYLLAAMALQEAFVEAVKAMDEVNLHNLLSYLQASDMPADESDVEKQVVVTTVHKAKGRQFDAVIYVPKQTRDNTSFQDEVVKAILKTKGINAEEELSEESLRVDFVAFTRAENELHILTNKPEEYLNGECENAEIAVESMDTFDYTERMKKAYSLFLNGSADKAKILLDSKTPWIFDFVKKHFDGLDRISFSYLEDDAYEYLVNRILNIREPSVSMTLGSSVHEIANKLAKGEYAVYEKELEPYAENIKSLLTQIRRDYPECVDTEKEMLVNLGQMIGTNDSMTFKGYIDAIFKNGGKYLIVDWKTDKNTGRASEHRQQLEAYRKALSLSLGIPQHDISVAIAFIGLRTTINTGSVDYEFDSKQPGKTSFDTFTKKANKILGWKKDPTQFFKDLTEKKNDELLWKSVVEEYKKTS